MPPGYTLERFSLDSYEKMKLLFRLAYGAAPDEKSFFRKYDTAALGHEVIGYLAIHEATDTPAAFYGVFPVKLLWHGAIIQAAQSGDTMTHPAHRKKGLFVELARICFETCRQKGLGLIFGMPNDNSYHGFIHKLDWQHRDNIAVYDLKLSLKTFPAPKIFLKAGRFDAYLKLANRLIKKKLVEQENFPNSLPASGKVLRDWSYLEYKTGADKFFIRIRGVVFWVRLTDVLWIGDVNDYTKMDEEVVRDLKRLAFSLGYNTVRFHINESVKEIGFLKAFQRQSALPSCIYYLDEAIKEANLLLTGCDFDTW